MSSSQEKVIPICLTKKRRIRASCTVLRIRVIRMMRKALCRLVMVHKSEIGMCLNLSVCWKNAQRRKNRTETSEIHLASSQLTRRRHMRLKMGRLPSWCQKKKNVWEVIVGEIAVTSKGP